MKYLLFVFTILLFSCTKSAEDKELSSNQSKWNRKNIVSYEFSLTINCFCPEERVGPHLIKVVDGQIVSVNNLPYDPSSAGALLTIDDLFIFIATSIERHPYKQTIEYNSTLGYPQTVWFDYNSDIADEELGYVVTGFKVL
jgi:hypothetical protein